MKYRPDIDGLRSVAILPVVATHVGILLHGGFVGVDVFFVISGFLITKLIWGETLDGSFSIANFYLRRIVRILPALFVMIAACLVVGFFILYPIDYSDLSKSAIAALLSLSNVYFWSVAGYFTDGAKLKPLLHTWSLGVEEQFYVLFPIILTLLARYAKRFAVAIVALIVVASFVLSCLQLPGDPRSTFYLLPARAWELGVGALLAMYPLSIARRPVVQQVAATLGLALIAGAVLLYTDRTPFPGPAALPPVLGAALIIWAGGTNAERPWVNRLLSWAPIVFIGQISYSLYLWHWPVLTVARIVGELTPAGKVGVVALSFVLAVLSWRFVERPFRKLRSTGHASRVFVGAAAAAVLLAAPATASIASDGFEARLSPAEARLETFLDYDVAKNYNYGQCFIGREHSLRNYAASKCIGDSSHVLLVGNSFAAHLLPGLKSIYGSVKQVTASGCMPLLTQVQEGSATCTAVLGRVIDPKARISGVDTVIVSADWEESSVKDLHSTLEMLRAKYPHVVVIGPLPLYSKPLARQLLVAEGRGPAPTPKHLAQTRALDESMARAAAGMTGVTYISGFKHFCGSGVCVQKIGGDPVQWDYGHLTAAGSTDLLQAAKRAGQLP